MSNQPQPPRPSLSTRFLIGLVWWIVAGFAILTITAIPAYIVGFAYHPRYAQFIYLSALIVALGGAIYGRYPPPPFNMGAGE